MFSLTPAELFIVNLLYTNWKRNSNELMSAMNGLSKHFLQALS